MSFMRSVFHHITQSSLQRAYLFVVWLLLLVVAGLWLAPRMQITGDLRAFMPRPVTADQHFLLDILGHGPADRLMLIGLTGSSPAQLARQSLALQHQLSGQTQLFDWVQNGSFTVNQAIPNRLLAYRYLWTDRYDQHPFNAATIHEMVQARIQDLGSSLSDQVEPFIPFDPTLELIHVAEQLQPLQQPHRAFGVWFDPSERSAVLIAQTRALGFDVTAQQVAVRKVEQLTRQITHGTLTRLIMSGPGVITVHINARTQREAQWIGVIDTISFILLLGFAYRSWTVPLLGILPLATAGLVGLLAVYSFSSQIHAMTLAFGFTLIGVVQDYPIHLLSHLRAGGNAVVYARELWPTLATGVISTCIAYLTFMCSGVEGLRQLALFTIAGLAAAAMSTRWLLPRLMGPTRRDLARSPRLVWLWHKLSYLPQPRGLLLLLGSVCFFILPFLPGPFWQNDLAQLTPMSRADLLQDFKLRSALIAPDVRYVIALSARSEQLALEKSESLRPILDQALKDGIITNYDYAARYLPTRQRQLQRQHALPDPLLVKRWLHEATVETPLREEIFASFISDLTTARHAATVGIEQIQGTALASLVNGLMLSQPQGSTALFTLTNVRYPDLLARRLSHSGARMVDLKGASESLVALMRHRIMIALTLASGVLIVVVAIALRQPVRLARVIMPMVISTIMIVFIERLCGVQLSLFHVISLILAACLGLDYALFFDHAGDDHGQQLRTLHALLICGATTFFVFLLLAFSAIPVLRAIGTTVALGVALNFVFAIFIARSACSGSLQGAKVTYVARS